MKIPKGYYLAIEGGEGVGKGTQTRLLIDKLESEYDVVSIREPGSTKTSEKIRSMLLHDNEIDLNPMTEVNLYNASRAQGLHEKVIPALNQDKLVIADRSWWSTYAYQGGGGQLNPETLKQMCLSTVRQYSPNLVFLLDMDVKQALQRKQEDKLDKIESRGLEYHKRVRNLYKQLAQEFNDSCVILDAAQSPQGLHNQIYNISKQRIQKAIKDRT